jgi:lysophospholipase L1-like esterase
MTMPAANRARTLFGLRFPSPQLAWLFFAIALLVFLVSLYLAIPRQKACRNCVVLMGDSITAQWNSLAQSNPLSGLQVANRGIPGDTTGHMLSRFDYDVVQLHPRVVVILGGINDIARIPLPAIEQNLASMAESAERHGIHVVLATLLPTGEPGAAVTSPIPSHDDVATGHHEILALNNWLRNLANQKHYALVDYHSALSDDRGYFQKGLTIDGVHPTEQGYQLMEPLLREAVQSALHSGSSER